MSEAPPPPSPSAGPAGPRERLALPGLGLIFVGLLNVLSGLALAGMGLSVRKPSPEQSATLEKALKAESPDLYKKWKAQDKSMEDDALPSVFYGTLLSGLLVGGLGALSVLAGLRMRQLRSWRLSLTASALTALPFLSPCACCLFGEVVGLWAFFVLTRPEVRAAFR
jgi:hypothetical protein